MQMPKTGDLYELLISKSDRKITKIHMKSGRKKVARVVSVALAPHAGVTRPFWAVTYTSVRFIQRPRTCSYVCKFHAPSPKLIVSVVATRLVLFRSFFSAAPSSGTDGGTQRE